MGYDTQFYGTLQYTRTLTDAELTWLTDRNARNVPGMREFRATNEGISYASEKTYDMVGLLNSITADARKNIPDFGLKGSLFARTEFEPYHWLVKINNDGVAEQVLCEMRELMHHDLRAYIDYLELKRKFSRSIPKDNGPQ
jgi:hypothetical protein